MYLLGSKVSMAGAIRPPGTYVMEANYYYYSCSASGRAALGVTAKRRGIKDAAGIPIDLEADIKVDGEACYQIPTVIWVAPGRVFGGDFGSSLVIPARRSFDRFEGLRAGIHFACAKPPRQPFARDTVEN